MKEFDQLPIISAEIPMGAIAFWKLAKPLPYASGKSMGNLRDTPGKTYIFRMFYSSILHLISVSSPCPGERENKEKRRICDEYLTGSPSVFPDYSQAFPFINLLTYEFLATAFQNVLKKSSPALYNTFASSALFSKSLRECWLPIKNSATPIYLSLFN